MSLRLYPDELFYNKPAVNFILGHIFTLIVVLRHSYIFHDCSSKLVLMQSDSSHVDNNTGLLVCTIFTVPGTIL